MDPWHVMISAAVGAVSGWGAFKWTVDSVKERWMADVRADYESQLEQLKSILQIEQKKLQAQLDRTVFVTKAQFDTEFSAVKDIYRYATEVWLAFQPIRPMYERRPAGQTREQRVEEVQEQLKLLIDAFNGFSKEIEILRPFYAENLYAALVECRSAAAREISQVQSSRDTLGDMEWYFQGDENRTVFTTAYAKTATLIRQRLDRLSVIPN